MATNLTNTTFSSTYKDDFKDSDNFHRVLFNSGKALQARELTQLQTIIQKEMQRFGSNIFRDGGVVEPGGVSINNKFEFIKLAANQLPTDTNDIINKVFTVKSPDPALEVKILKVIAATGSDPDTLFVEYVSTSAGTSGSTTVRVGNSQVLENTTLGSNYDMTTATTGAAGVGTEASVAKGVYFVQGHFVFVEKQSIFIDKYSGTPDAEIGFLVSETVQTASDNSALYDNQGATPNLAAPGADRYQINLTLKKRSDITSSQNFVYVANIKNGKINDETRTDNSYSTINDLLALRTKEESGNYIVKPINARHNEKDSATSPNLELEVSDGIVYVDGYRLEAANKKITVPKSQTSETLENEIIVAKYGSYVKGNIDDNKGLPNVDTLAKVNLRDAIAHGGSTIGTARIRYVEEDGGTSYRFYMFDIRMNSGENFSSVKSFGTSTSDYVDVTLEGGVAVLKNTANNNLLFPLPRTRPTQSGVTVDAITVQKRITFTSTGSGTITAVNVPSGYTTFTNTGQWIFSRTNNQVDTSASVTLGSGNTQFDASGLQNSSTYEVLAQVTKSSPTARAKTMATTNITRTWPTDAESDGTGVQFISLDKADIYDVESIKLNDSDGNSMAFNFTVDNGQRDNYYGIGRLVKKQGISIPTGTQIYSKFKYFEHNTTGDFFDITSYPTADVPYHKIPNHTLSDGTEVSLRDVIDFRPRANKAHNSADNTVNIAFDSNGQGGAAIINALPTNTNSFSADVVYYLPRRDRLVATTVNAEGERLPRGQVKLVQGVPGFDPLLPETPSGSMPLFNFSLNPYTLNESDLTSEFIPAKRFTMSDISELEQRIDKLQELTTLSLLELNTSSLEVIDSSGNPRTKAGFLADNFKNTAFSALDKDEYRAAIDELEGLALPLSIAKNTRLIYDSDNSTTERHGDLVTLPIANHVSMINQNLATETENINPFAVIVSSGHMELSPGSDEWVETTYAPDNVIDGGTESRRLPTRMIARIRQTVHSFRDRWLGTPVGGRVLVRGDVTNRRTIIGDRILDVSFIPFMRSRKISFRVNGLRRDTKHFMFFGGRDISNYARKEDFQFFGTRNDNVGNIYTNTTSHPDGTNSLISDSIGNLEGSFIIPSNSELRFRTGAQRVELMDISSGVFDNATSKAQTIFQSTGILNTRQRTVQNIRVENEFFVQEYDPLAQSFRVDGADNPNGVFITKVDTFFSTKAGTPGVPVQMQIRTMENGSPTSSPIPGAIKFLRPDQVSIPSDLTDIATIRSTPTTFEFDEPVYLEPQRDYAIVLLADTTDYNVFVARTYDFIVGSTEQRVSKQPTLGSMFLSQNGITWTPDQARDLMFNLHRASFSTSASMQSTAAEPANELLEADPLLMDSGSTTVRIFHEGHGFSKNDHVTIAGLDSTDSAGVGVKGASIMGSRQIINVDHTGYTIAADSSATASLRIGGNGVIVSSQAMFDTFVPQVQTLLPDNTTLSASIKLTKGSSYADGRNTASAPGIYGKMSSYKSITLNDFNTNDEPKVIPTGTQKAKAPLSGTEPLDLKIDMSTTDSKVSPIIDLQRNSIATFENIIDKQHASSTSEHNIPISIVEETNAEGGTHAAKHITVPITLEEPAVGLKILFAANRPKAAGFEVYYRASTDDDLNDVAFIEVAEATNNPADEDGTTFRQYEFLAGGQGGHLPAFTQFQVKIVMTSTNSSKIPKIKDLRAIALVT